MYNAKLRPTRHTAGAVTEPPPAVVVKEEARVLERQLWPLVVCRNWEATEGNN